jgi:hypothetical protein
VGVVVVSLGTRYLGKWVSQMATRAERFGCCVIGYQYLGKWVSQMATRAGGGGCCVIGNQVTG